MEYTQLIAQAVVSGLLKAGIYSLVAIGMALSLGVVKILNLAHGDFIMLAQYLSIFIFAQMGLDPLIAAPIVFIIFAIFGFGIFKGLIRFAIKTTELNQLLLTFGLSIFLQNTILMMIGADPKTIFVSYRNVSLSFLGTEFGFGRLIAFLIALIILFALFYILKNTKFGKCTRAVSQNIEGAYLIGIEAERIQMVAFGLSIAIAALGGSMLSIILSAHPTIGLEFTIKSLAIVVVAGFGNIYGVIWASAVLGILESMVSTLLPGGTGLSGGVFFLLIFVFLIMAPIIRKR